MSGLLGILILFMLLLFFLHIATCVWAYRDSIRNGRSQEYAIMVLIAILMFPVIGLLIYLFIRNDGGSSSGRNRY